MDETSQSGLSPLGRADQMASQAENASAERDVKSDLAAQRIAVIRGLFEDWDDPHDQMSACGVIAIDGVYEDVGMVRLTGASDIGQWFFVSRYQSLIEHESVEILSIHVSGDMIFAERQHRRDFGSGKYVTIQRVMSSFKFEGLEIVEWRDYHADHVKESDLPAATNHSRRTIPPRSGPGPRVGLFQDEADAQSRELAEIIRTEHQLAEKVWYDRFQMTRSNVGEGVLKVVPDREAARRDNEIAESVWQAGNVNAKVVEAEHGPANLGPYSDFEWGFLTGKLSAIRWVLGEDWDNLST